MTDDKKRDWVDTTAKLLIPVVICGATALISLQKYKSDLANQQFERESGMLKLAASASQSERDLGLKMIRIQVDAGKWSKEMLPVVQAISEGKPSDSSTQAAQTILASAAKQDKELSKQIQPVSATQTATVYLQISRGDQRAQAESLREKLVESGRRVPGIELVTVGTSNNYVRYFSGTDVELANQILALMTDMGYTVKTQDFSAINQGKIPAGQIEVWIGEKQGPLALK